MQYFPGLSSNKAEDTFLNILWKNDAQIYVKSYGKGYVSVKKDSFVFYVLEFFGILAGWYNSVVVGERDENTKGPGVQFSKTFTVKLPCIFEMKHAMEMETCTKIYFLSST